ncbi:hypothetical protein R1sor_005231 [Riccia sorocarpa]|uniref:PLAT domain-containing protein n=1 Tax=Riccia sorocarpa TaxID=122646 RepID=A0ABD3HNA8_9MARC
MTAMAMVTLLIALVLLSSTSVLAKDDCVYTVFVKTGSVKGAGTDSTIGATFYTAEGGAFEIANFTSWGNPLEPNKDYFESSNLDVFSGYGDCLSGPICKIKLTSDEAGDFSAWFCESVEITAANSGKKCSTHHFTVNQWLSTYYLPDYNLTSSKEGKCSSDSCDSEMYVLAVLRTGVCLDHDERWVRKKCRVRRGHH